MITSKKKSDLASTLDDLQHNDSRRRLSAVQSLKDVAAALGPLRTKNELIGFLAEFVDDEENIVLELLEQLSQFGALLGGGQNQRVMLPLLIAFCKTDEKRVALRSVEIIRGIVSSSRELALETIKKLLKNEMNVSVECGLQLLVSLLGSLEMPSAVVVSLIAPLHLSENPQTRILASKYLCGWLKEIKEKEQASRILEGIYSEGSDLEKIYALDALLAYYPANSNMTLTKLKHLCVTNSWRINIKIAQLVPQAAELMSSAHFKSVMEPILLKFLISAEPQLRAAACRTLAPACRHMSEEQQKAKLQGPIRKLAADQVEFVKIELTRQLGSILGAASGGLMADCLVPTILLLMKDKNGEIALAVAKNFEVLATKIPKYIVDERIVQPLLQQLATDNWRIKCEIISLLKKFILQQAYLTEPVMKVLLGLTEDRVDAVRLKAKDLLIEMLSSLPQDWCEQQVVPRVLANRDNQSYIRKQNLLDLIEKTYPHVSQKAFKDYQATVALLINDKVPNVRLRGLHLLTSNSKLMNAGIEKQVERLKEDGDPQVRELAKQLRG